MMDAPPYTREESYYSAFLPTFAVIAGFGMLLGLGFIVIRHGANLNPVGLVVGLGSAFGLAVAFTALAIPCYPVYISATGLRSYNVWGVYRSASWDQIASIGSFNL